jgi:hypothetical protein
VTGTSAPKTLLGALLPTPAVLVVAAIGALLGAIWLVPGSPATLWRADAALGGGDGGRALALYDDVAEHGWATSLRRSALRRSAALLSTELGRPAEARVRLERLIVLEEDPAVVADLHERVAHLWAASHEPELATRSFVASVQAAPRHPRAAERLVQAGRAATEAGREALAVQLWERLAAHYPSHLAVARLAQGRAALAVDDAQGALRLFDEALTSAASPDLRAAARLGISTSLERLGNLDEAIAELDHAELPGNVRGSRLDVLRTRRDVRGR